MPQEYMKHSISDIVKAYLSIMSRAPNATVGDASPVSLSHEYVTIFH